MYFGWHRDCLLMTRQIMMIIRGFQSGPKAFVTGVQNDVRTGYWQWVTTDIEWWVCHGHILRDRRIWSLGMASWHVIRVWIFTITAGLNSGGYRAHLCSHATTGTKRMLRMEPSTVCGLGWCTLAGSSPAIICSDFGGNGVYVALGPWVGTQF